MLEGTEFSSRNLLGNLVVLVALFIFDKFFASAKARWFSIHAFANLLVCITSIPAIVITITDPHDAMDSRIYSDTTIFGTASPWPIIIVNSVHIYHMLPGMGFGLTGADYFHHLMFIPTVGFIGQYYDWGALRGFLAFFISGLPGGIDYFNLVLIKHGMMNIRQQKRICADLNIWMRGPFIVIETWLMYQAWLYGKTTVPGIPLCIVAVLSVFNAQYYTKQAVANHAISHAIGHVEQRISVTTGMSVPKWGKEMKEPQNTMS
jgi:hypothetical protein